MEIDHFKKIFIDETVGHLSSLESSLVDLEVDFNNKEIVRQVFRIMHTIKGNSGMFGFDKIVEVTHDLENIYDLVRASKLTVTTELIDVSFSTIDHIRNLLFQEDIDEKTLRKQQEILSNIESFKKGMKLNIAGLDESLKSAEVAEDEKLRTWHIILRLDNDIEKRAINLFYVIQDLYDLGKCYITYANFEENNQGAGIFLVSDQSYDEIEEVLMFVEDYYEILLIAEFDIFDEDEVEFPIFNGKNSMSIIDATENPDKYLELLHKMQCIKQQQQNLHLSSTISVDVEKLDNLMFLVSELVTVKSELQNSLEQNDIERSIYAAEKIENLSKLFNQNALDLRLVPIHEITEKYKRQIRDLAKQVEKEIHFEVIGGEIELDKHIIDTLCEPLMHLLRNAIDHGIETPEKREAKGKNRVGKVTVKASCQGNNVFLKISDDGNGISKDFIFNKAVERGIISSEAELSDRELYDLIFYPGFSTVQTLSNISGRGVGMDVVLKKIEEIRGEITVESEEGVGTTFILKLQQTISIIDTLLVENNDIVYAIPIEDIESCTFIPVDEKMDKERGLINLEGTLTPYVYIENDFGLKANKDGKLVVIRRNDLRFAMVVDRVIGEFQAVIKPLTGVFREMRFLMGATFLGDGSLALLLDTEKLWETSENININ